MGVLFCLEEKKWVIIELKKNFFINTDFGFKKFINGEILYDRQSGRDVEIATLKGEYIVKNKKLTSIEEIEDNRFYRCHNYFIVNITLIDRMDKNEIYFINKKMMSVGKNSYNRIVKYLKENHGYDNLNNQFA